MSSNFRSQVASYTEDFLIEKGVTSVFPLFTPEGEKLWAPGWDYTNIMGSEDLHPDDVFLTDSHDHRSTTAIWIVSSYDSADHFVSYYKVEPGEKIGKITVQCTEQNAERTIVKVTYKYIGLSESGNRFVADFTEKTYKTFIEEWCSLINAHFKEKSTSG